MCCALLVPSDCDFGGEVGGSEETENSMTQSQRDRAQSARVGESEVNRTSRITASNVNNPNADLLHGWGFIYKSQVGSKAHENGTRIAGKGN